MLKCQTKIQCVDKKTEKELCNQLRKAHNKKRGKERGKERDVGASPEPVLILVLDKNGNLTPLGLKRVKEPRTLAKTDFPLDMKIDGLPETYSILHVESDEGCYVISGNGGAVFVPC